jgi:hypothetical protein
MIVTKLWPLSRVPFTQLAHRLNAIYDAKGLLPISICHIPTTDGPGALLVVFGETREAEPATAPAGADPAAAAAEPPHAAAAAPELDDAETPATAPPAVTTTVTIDPAPASNGSNGADVLGDPEVIAAQ